jgi:squalene-hopene/tetraprenyl-beta-curcumene cyclase
MHPSSREARLMPGTEGVARQVRVDTAKSRLERCIERATAGLLKQQRSDGHWVFELEADATIAAEYVVLQHFLGESNPALEAKIAICLRRLQGPHGGWSLFHGGAFNISASVKAYLALKLIGDAPDSEHLRRAREAILAHGGAGATNVFTRILLAFFGMVPWSAVPIIRIPAAVVSVPSVANRLLEPDRSGAAAGAPGFEAAGPQSARRTHR